MEGRKYAAGHAAWGECARSGQRMLLRDMVRDPRTGLWVAPDWAEPVDPRPPLDLVDGIALQDMAPRLDQVGAMAFIGNLSDLTTGDPMRPLVAKFALGQARGTAT